MVVVAVWKLNIFSLGNQLLVASSENTRKVWHERAEHPNIGLTVPLTEEEESSEGTMARQNYKSESSKAEWGDVVYSFVYSALCP